MTLKLKKKKRFQFARDHKDWTLEQWKQVMWSDESRFTLFQSDGCKNINRSTFLALPFKLAIPNITKSGFEPLQ